MIGVSSHPLGLSQPQPRRDLLNLMSPEVHVGIRYPTGAHQRTVVERLELEKLTYQGSGHQLILRKLGQLLAIERAKGAVHPLLSRVSDLSCSLLKVISQSSHRFPGYGPRRTESPQLHRPLYSKHWYSSVGAIYLCKKWCSRLHVPVLHKRAFPQSCS